MDERIRDRLRLALQEKGLINRHREISKQAGLNELYIYQALLQPADSPKQPRGGLSGFHKIADVIGLSWEWLVSGTGEQWRGARTIQPLDRADVTAGIESVLLFFHPRADLTDIRFLAETVLAIAENPPDGMSEIDRLSRIRIGIHGALRQFWRRSGGGNKE